MGMIQWGWHVSYASTWTHFDSRHKMSLHLKLKQLSQGILASRSRFKNCVISSKRLYLSLRNDIFSLEKNYEKQGLLFDKINTLAAHLFA